MTQANFFNKGTAKGKVTRVEVVDYENKTTKEKKHFLSMEVDTLTGNKAKITLFPTKNDPNKDKDIKAAFPIGTIVKVEGRVSENEFKTKTGQTGIERSISANKVEAYFEDTNYMVTFVIQGIVEQIKQSPNGTLITISHNEDYKDENGNTVEKEPSFFTVQATEEMVFESGVEKGCNAKFKGQILNQVIYDDYGDVVGKSQMFKTEKIESVVPADELTTDEELEENPFL